MIDNLGTADEIETDFYYTADREEFMRTDRSKTTKTTTFYWGDYEIASIDDGKSMIVEEKHYIGPAIRIKRNDGKAITKITNELLTDALGSVTAITDEIGHVVARYQYTPFGMQEFIGGQPLDHPITHRGFTGHEEIEGMNLIHMKGRLYDPLLGRFLSADPYIQDPSNGQSLNRYSYCFNNPLTLTDPTGYFSWDDFIDAVGDLIHAIGHAISQCLSDPNIAQAIGIALSILAYVYPPAGIAKWMFSALVSSAYGGIETAQNGGSVGDALRCAAISFGSACAFHGIGLVFGDHPAFGTMDWGESSIAHGLVGGGMQAMENFQDK